MSNPHLHEPRLYYKINNNLGGVYLDDDGLLIAGKASTFLLFWKIGRRDVESDDEELVQLVDSPCAAQAEMAMLQCVIELKRNCEKVRPVLWVTE